MNKESFQVVCEDDCRFLKQLAYQQLIKGHEGDLDYVRNALRIVEELYPDTREDEG